MTDEEMQRRITQTTKLVQKTTRAAVKVLAGCDPAQVAIALSRVAAALLNESLALAREHPTDAIGFEGALMERFRSQLDLMRSTGARIGRTSEPS